VKSKEAESQALKR